MFRDSGGIDPIDDVNLAASRITVLKDPKAKLARLNEMLAGHVSIPANEPGKALLHRRALLVTALNKDSLWG